jgi:hypothetical protein
LRCQKRSVGVCGREVGGGWWVVGGGWWVVGGGGGGGGDFDCVEECDGCSGSNIDAPELRQLCQRVNVSMWSKFMIR